VAEPGWWRKQGNANQKQQMQKRVVATAMGDDDGRRLTEDRRPVGSTWQQQQIQKRVVAHIFSSFNDTFIVS